MSTSGPMKKSSAGDLALAVRAAHDHAGIEHDDRRRHVGRATPPRSGPRPTDSARDSGPRAYPRSRCCRRRDSSRRRSGNTSSARPGTDCRRACRRCGSAGSRPGPPPPRARDSASESARSCSISVSVVIAPISMPPSASRMPRSDAMPVRSTTFVGTLVAVLEPAQRIVTTRDRPGVLAEATQQIERRPRLSGWNRVRNAASCLWTCETLLMRYVSVAGRRLRLDRRRD